MEGKKKVIECDKGEDSQDIVERKIKAPYYLDTNQRFQKIQSLPGDAWYLYF